jgi:tetratricopeptide (TPR) repeat protein
VTKGPVAEGLGRAEALAEAGEYAAALEELDGVLSAGSATAEIHTARGWALENLGPERLADARAAYEQALALNEGAMWAKEGLANVMRRMGHADEADRLCVEVIEEGRRRYHDEEDLWIAVRFDLALALLCSGDRVRAFLEYTRGVHQAVNGGVERLRGVVRVAIDDLDECLSERPALATTREAIAVRDLLVSTLPADSRVG